MRKIILMMPVSADGFMEGPERELGWHKADSELHRHFNEQLTAMGALREIPGGIVEPVTCSVGLSGCSAHVRQARSRCLLLRCCPGVTVVTLGRPPYRAREGRCLLLGGPRDRGDQVVSAAAGEQPAPAGQVVRQRVQRRMGGALRVDAHLQVSQRIEPVGVGPVLADLWGSEMRFGL